LRMLLRALGLLSVGNPGSTSPCGCERYRIARCLVSAVLAKIVDSRAVPGVRARGEAADLDENGLPCFRTQRICIQATAEKRLRYGPGAASFPISFAPGSIFPA